MELIIDRRKMKKYNRWLQDILEEKEKIFGGNKMSRDNGMVIKKFSDTDFKVYEYDNSAGSETLRGSYFTTLEEALEFASAQGTEFGVTYQIVTKQSKTKKEELTMEKLRTEINWLKGTCYFLTHIPDNAKVTFEWTE